ncbi:Autophagy protein 22 [Terramyces sp. JEL0728]|nr:Autophagy protein 22 [Terramyces sp. JEL0728]
MLQLPVEIQLKIASNLYIRDYYELSLVVDLATFEQTFPAFRQSVLYLESLNTDDNTDDNSNTFNSLATMPNKNKTVTTIQVNTLETNDKFKILKLLKEYYNKESFTFMIEHNLYHQAQLMLDYIKLETKKKMFRNIVSSNEFIETKQSQMAYLLLENILKSEKVEVNMDYMDALPGDMPHNATDTVSGEISPETVPRDTANSATIARPEAVYQSSTSPEAEYQSSTSPEAEYQSSSKATANHPSSDSIKTTSETLTNESITLVQDAEIKGWYSYAFASEGYSTLLSTFYPIVLQQLYFDQGRDHSNHDLPCTTGNSCDVYLFGWMDTTTLVYYATTTSVLLMLVVYILLGPIGDYSFYRKKLLYLFGTLNCIFGILMLTIVDSKYYIYATVLFILGNVSFGGSFVFYYSFIPILTRYHPSTIKQPEKREEFMDNLSTFGFLYGYVGGVIVLLISIIVILICYHYGFEGVYPMQICIAFSCIWQLVIMYSTSHLLKDRKGPDLPSNPLLNSLLLLKSTLQKAQKLKELFKFLIVWFMASDGASTISTVAILFFQTELGISQIGLVIVAIISPIAAILGNYFFNQFKQKTRKSTRSILIIQLIMIGILPIWGLIGFFTPKNTFGLQAQWEIYPLSLYFGFVFGASQSSCRVMYSELIPQGHESEFFGLYELTDKGSAWIGPLVAGYIANNANKRFTFVYLFVCFLCALGVFITVDVDKGKQDAQDYLLDL